MLGYDTAPGGDSSSRAGGEYDAGVSPREANLDESIRILQNLSLSPQADSAEVSLTAEFSICY
jgi:hypothetical protein